MLRLVVGALLLVLAFAGGYAVAACKTVTLTVDGTAMRVTTMKSRVIDIVEENGFSVDDRDDLYPAAGVQVHDADTIVLRRSRPLQISLDGHDAKQVWTTASTVDEALAQLAMTDMAPAADRIIDLLSRARDSLQSHGSIADLADAGHAARTRYDSFPRSDIVTVVIGADKWREQLAAAGRAGGVITSALPSLDSPQ